MTHHDASRARPSASRIAPFLWDDIADTADWRERLAWPVSMAAMRAAGERVCSLAIRAVGGLDDDLDRQVGAVAAGNIINAFMALLEAALVAQGEALKGIAALGGPPELAALRDADAEVAVLADRHRGKGVLDVAPARHARLRALARTASWTPLARLPASLLAPQATAVSHNALLKHHARAAGVRVGYRHAASIVAAARRTPPRLPESVQALAERLVAALLPAAEGLDEPWRGRFAALLTARLRPTLERVAGDVLALRSARLPRRLWSGSNGAYANRLLSAEVRRRGGEATGFDHGGVTAISQVLGLTAVAELMTATRFVLGTRAWARLLADSGVAALLEPFPVPELIGADGEPLFRAACIDGEVREGRRRVLYVGHPYRGLRQFAIAGTPDVIYWDLQSRVAAKLAGLAVELVCKPHPEGAFVGRRNPIEDVAPTSYRRFEDHLTETDLFVFDAPTSTTFAEALCTNRPVVLIDRGHYPMNPGAAPLVRARCRMVPSTTDEGGRIWPDEAALEAAVLGGPDTADPSAFRSLLAGEGA